MNATRLPTPKTGPRVIGVNHRRHETLAEVEQHIAALPPGSTVALERDEFDPTNQRFVDIENRVVHISRWIYSGPKNADALAKFEKHEQARREACSYFRKVAAIAQQHGHSIYWLERPLSRQMPNQVEFQRQLAALEKKFSTTADLKPSEALRDLRAFLEGYIQHRNRFEMIQGLFRSRIMNRFLERKKDWKPTDPAFMGAAHAIHLHDEFGRPIHEIIPELHPDTIQAVRDRTTIAREWLDQRTSPRHTKPILRPNRKRK